MSYPQPLAVVIMAAGKGTRMKDPTRAKVMFEINGHPLLHYVIELAGKLSAKRIIAIAGFQKESVTAYLAAAHPTVEVAYQLEQKGTGHAVMQTAEALRNFQGQVLVLSGDVPLLTVKTMQAFVDHHFASGASATILTADFDDPTGYGRIIRNPDGTVKKITEHKDATPEELALQEINSGIYVFDRALLYDALEHITPHNAQNEYYLTDVFEYFWRHGHPVQAVKGTQGEIHGINTVEQLEEARQILTKRAEVS